MTLRHYAFSRQHRTQFSEDVYAFVLWRYVAVQIWRVKELFVPGIVASTIKTYKYMPCSYQRGEVIIYENRCHIKVISQNEFKSI